jgi:hypothetical protein
MTINDMRGHIIASYPGSGPDWRKKVLSWSESKVLAMYRSLQRQKKVK